MKNYKKQALETSFSFRKLVKSVPLIALIQSTKSFKNFDSAFFKICYYWYKKNGYANSHDPLPYVTTQNKCFQISLMFYNFLSFSEMCKLW